MANKMNDNILEFRKKMTLDDHSKQVGLILAK